MDGLICSICCLLFLVVLYFNFDGILGNWKEVVGEEDFILIYRSCFWYVVGIWVLEKIDVGS